MVMRNMGFFGGISLKAKFYTESKNANIFVIEIVSIEVHFTSMNLIHIKWTT